MTIELPGAASPGNGSPQQVLTGVATAFSTRHYTDLCKYMAPSTRSGCTAAWRYFLSPAIKVNGTWYAYTVNSTIVHF